MKKYFIFLIIFLLSVVLIGCNTTIEETTIHNFEYTTESIFVQSSIYI